jgi:hypothetical protein
MRWIVSINVTGNPPIAMLEPGELKPQVQLFSFHLNTSNKKSFISGEVRLAWCAFRMMRGALAVCPGL